MMFKTDSEEDFKTWWAKNIFLKGMVRFGEFTLKSGDLSPIYLNMRDLVGAPWMLTVCAKLCEELIRDEGLNFDRILGLPLGGMPAATALSLQMQVPMVYTRANKTYGISGDTDTQIIEGPFESGEKVIIFDDVVSTAGTKLEALTTARNSGLAVSDILVLIDRSGKANLPLEEAGVTLHSLFKLPELLSIWAEEDLIDKKTADTVWEFLDR